ncbi:non-ribosomal peptide synthetase [Thalassomonas sp. RHCl1]|uniref:non-ribosomal peptide synthetase n=1 Tax=Thalassomonas sp. RHCl1 TaxID=2995320 RepID=UPI00248C4151|nr:non-ribosomal peptide synthetase [Thalassomonas sp. RHCl1]
MSEVNVKDILIMLAGKGVSLAVKDNRLSVKGKLSQLDADDKALLQSHKSEIIAFIQTRQQSEQTSIPVRTQQENLPLSFAQQRLWFVDQLQGSSEEYNMPSAFEVEGDFNADVAEQVLTEIIKRHQVLRTVYIDGDDDTVQVIRDDYDFSLGRFDLTSLDAQNRQNRLMALIDEDMKQPFDLARDLMIRASFIALDSGKGVLLFNMHHIASDGWSMNVLVGEFIALYQAIISGQASPLAPLDIQYADYALWQRDYLKGDVLEQQLGYWDKQLADMPPVHTLALDHPRPDIKGHSADRVSRQLSGDIAKQLQDIAGRYKLTPFMLMHSALALVLSRHSNSTDIVIGTPVANRMQSELEPLIGFFVNNLVLRLDTSHARLDDYLAHVRQVHFDAQNNQDVPFEQIVERLNIPRNSAYTPLFQIMLSTNNDFALGETSAGEVMDLNGARLSPLASDTISAKFDLEVAINISEQGVGLDWIYDTNLFNREHAEQLIEHLAILLTSMAQSKGLAETELAFLDIMSEQESDYLLNVLNDTRQEYPQDKLIHELFEAQAAATPDNLALSFNGTELSYRELNERANRLAHYLRERGVQTEDFVGICLERSHEMLVAILAVLKAGGAYVPLDPAYPQARLEYMLADTGLKYVISQAELNASLFDSDKIEVIELETWQQLSRDFSCENPLIAKDLDANSLAYVIYTSGSTGQPKGVLLEHRGAVNLGLSQSQAFAVQENSRVLQFASLNFDAATSEWLMAFVIGAALVVCDEQTRQSADTLQQVLLKESISHVTLPPALLALLDHHRDYALESLIVAGEACDPALVKIWASKCRMFNAYGPSEGTVCASIAELEPQGPVSIGRAMANVSLYVFDQAFRLTPKGCIGELYIGGDGVSRGYLNKAQLTQKSFIQNPFSDKAEDRLYKTGDLVRYLANGDLDFIGRVDDQVKINGFRIELGEIENQLSSCQGLSSCLVTTREVQAGQKQLLAYITPEIKDITEEQQTSLIESLKQTLTASLPHYMVPAMFVVIYDWPVTANGKVDKKALPSPDAALLQGNYQAPQTELESKLVNIWAQLLNLEADKISTGADFFALGGHSLLTIRLVAEIRKQLEVELAVKAVFDAGTIQAMAQLIEADVRTPLRLQVLPVTRGQETMPLSFAQQRLWVIDQLQGGSPEYNMPAAFEVQGAFDIHAAEQALSAIIKRHQVLRTVYIEQDKQTQQKILSDFSFAITRHDFTALEQQVQQQELLQLIEQDVQKPFVLSTDLMVRASYVALENSTSEKQARGALLFNMHHIAGDGWSMSVLIREFVAAYQAITKGQTISLPELDIQYADYAHWQQEWSQGEQFASQLDYWQQQLAEVPPVHSLVLDKARPEVPSHLGASVRGQLPADIAASLQALAGQYKLTPFMLLHAALSLVLSRHSNSNDIIIGTAVANRMQAELEPLIGFFVNTLVLRVDTGHQLLADYLRHIRQVHLDAQANQDVPFEQLVEQLKVPRGTSYTPLFQIMMGTNTDYGLGDNSLAMADTSLTPLSSEHISTKFDLDIDMVLDEQGVSLNWTYDTGLFSHEHVSQFNEHLLNVLNAMAQLQQQGADVAGTQVAALAMLSEQESEQLLAPVNECRADEPQEMLIHEIFEKRAADTPDKIALTLADEELSYRQLNERANQLGHYLREQGVQAGTLVGLCFERSLEMVIAMLGILKAGGGYVPLDPGYPEARLNYMLDNSGVKHLVTQAHLSELLQLNGETRVVSLGGGQETDIDRQPKTNLASEHSSDNIAYMIYTSGSTGQPKGVMITHNNWAAYLEGIEQDYQLTPSDRVLQFSSISFDIFIEELSASLLCGGTLVLPPPGKLPSCQQYWQWLKEYQITLASLPTAYWHQLCVDEQLASDSRDTSLRLLITGGEAMSGSHLQQWQQHVAGEIRLLNTYGPTETTVIATICDVTCYQDDGRSVPIGKPLKHSQVLLLTQSLSLVPEGAVGEVYVTGAMVGAGYFNDKEKTDKHFIANPFSSEKDSILYRTGDLARYGKNGELEFVGRGDNQVKIRGFRIEVEEIESQLALCEEVANSLILVREDEPGDKTLVAYVTLAEQAAAQAEKEHEITQHIMAQLQAKLPAYMLPSAVVVMDELPLTANGKLDKKALPAPDNSLIQGEYVAPQTETETALAQIWGKLLKRDADTLSTRASFFALGGHSLLVIRMITEIKNHFDVESTVAKLFESQTIHNVATYIDNLLLAKTIDAGLDDAEVGEEGWL